MFSSDYGDDYLRVIRNTSKDNVVSYAPVNLFTAGTSNPYESVSADFDGDGKLDVVMPGHWSSAVGVFRNTSVPGAISFGPAQVLWLALTRIILR